MLTESRNETRIVPPYSGRAMCAFGDEVTVHLGAAETGGRYTLFTCVTPPGNGPPPHFHANEDEWFLVLEGRVEFLKDAAWVEVPVGSVVYTPRGVVHAYRNCGDVPLRMLIQTSPAGFETFFSRCAEVFALPGPPDMARLVAIAEEHGIHFPGG
ncbi:MAG: cupin domain-containing protein [Phycisphaeraceae bacterium]|nr:cupin domain-containing protein [Phycisphaeraceae bacterium]